MLPIHRWGDRYFYYATAARPDDLRPTRDHPGVGISYVLRFRANVFWNTRKTNLADTLLPDLSVANSTLKLCNVDQVSGRFWPSFELVSLLFRNPPSKLLDNYT